MSKKTAYKIIGGVLFGLGAALVGDIKMLGVMAIVFAMDFMGGKD